MSVEDIMVEKRLKRPAMWRGARARCPACGEKTMFHKYLKVSETCSACGLHLGGHQADDAPPYFTIFIVGHIIVPVALIVERSYMPPLYVHAFIFGILSIVISLISLPIVKGAVVGLQWALELHGFAPETETPENAKPEDTKEDAHG